MSSSSERLILAATLLVAGGASAGLDPVPSRPAASVPMRPAGTAATVDAGASGGRSMFRCWQYGRLIYQGPAGPVSIERQAGVPRLAIAGGAQVYDLKSAVCILDGPAGAVDAGSAGPSHRPD